MARINIEDDFWDEIQAVIELVGDRDKAIGNALRFFRFAQTRYKDGRVVTETDFIQNKFLKELKNIFALPVEGGGYIAAGSEKHFSWLKERAEAGRKGGKASAKKRKTVADNEKNANAEIIKKVPQANPSNSKQTEPSYSYSYSEEENKKGEEIPIPKMIKMVWETWNETLQYFDLPSKRISPNQERIIFNAIRKNNFENVILAAEGKRYEKSFKDYKPEDNLSIEALLKTDKAGNYDLEKHVNRALLRKEEPKKMTDEEQLELAQGRNYNVEH